MTPGNIGQFEIRQLLGSGGFGHVYAAMDTELGRLVAIKALRPEIAANRALVERFRAEGVGLARLNHTNITTLYALQRQDQELFLVMELVHGQTLDAVLARLHRLGPTETLAVIAQTASGLGYAHRMGVIHRDIKPANLMLTDGGVVKIMDFGIARIRGTQRLTQAGLLGTYAYLAPEQFSRAEGNERSDLYSMACVVYEMLSGSIPFDAPSEAEMMRGHLTQPPQPLRALLPDLDPRIDAAVLRALAKDPAERFATVEAFSEAVGATAIAQQAADIVRDRILARVPAPPRLTTLTDPTALGGTARRFTPPVLGGKSSGKRPLSPVVVGVVSACLAAVLAVAGWQLLGGGSGQPARPDAVATATPPATPLPPLSASPPLPNTQPAAPAVVESQAGTTAYNTAPAPLEPPRRPPGREHPAVFPPPPDTHRIPSEQSRPPGNAVALAPVPPLAPPAAPTPSPEPSGADASALAGMTVVEVIASSASPEAVMQEALRRFQAGHVADADALLEEAATTMHYVPALGALARRYDPGQPHPSGVRPDARRAARFYREAVRNGDTSVAGDRAALRTALEHLNSGGDRNAEFILGEFWP